MVGDLSCNPTHNTRKFPFAELFTLQLTWVATLNTAAPILEVSHHFGSVFFVLSWKVGENLCNGVFQWRTRSHHWTFFRTTLFKWVQELFKNWFMNCRMLTKSTLQHIVEYFHACFSVTSGCISWQWTPTTLTRSEEPHTWQSNFLH